MTTPNHNDLSRDLGKIEKMQEAMEGRMDRFEKLVTDGFDKIDKKLDGFSERLTKLEASENQRTGAWTASQKILAGIGSFVILVLGGLVSLAVNHLGIK